MNQIIAIDSIVKSYQIDEKPVNILKSISFSVKEGEFVAIVGPSGSGKSTLLHILGLLDSPTSGTYTINGKNVSSISLDEQAHLRNEQIGFVFQAFNLLPKYTVYENVRLPLLYSSVPEHTWDEKIRNAIDSVAMSHRVEYQAYRLSGGEKQRVAIARALVLNPKVMFADEPTGNLDSKSGETVMAILRDLNIKSGHTIILITHDNNVAKQANRIVRIKDGMLYEEDKHSLQ